MVKLWQLLIHCISLKTGSISGRAKPSLTIGQKNNFNLSQISCGHWAETFSNIFLKLKTTWPVLTWNFWRHRNKQNAHLETKSPYSLISFLVVEKFMNNLHCLQPRLARKFAKKRSKYKSSHQFFSRQYQYHEESEDELLNSFGKQHFERESLTQC